MGGPHEAGQAAPSLASSPSFSMLGETEVLAHARAELAGFKVPVRVVFVDDLPRSTIEKLARSRLRERAARLVEGTAHEHS